MPLYAETPVEYEFTLADGSKRYEIAIERGDVQRFFKMHRAVSCRPAQDFPHVETKRT
jgi:hypothetical protein